MGLSRERGSFQPSFGCVYVYVCLSLFLILCLCVFDAARRLLGSIAPISPASCSREKSMSASRIATPCPALKNIIINCIKSVENFRQHSLGLRYGKNPETPPVNVSRYLTCEWRDSSQLLAFLVA